MARYIAKVDGEGPFGAVFPDAPGCTAMGDTFEELVDNAAAALADWASEELAAGRAIPAPRTYVQLLRIGKYDLGTGMVVTIPLILESGKSTRANISIDTGVLAAIDEAASRLGVTRSTFLASAAKARIVESA